MTTHPGKIQDEIATRRSVQQEITIQKAARQQESRSLNQGRMRRGPQTLRRHVSTSDAQVLGRRLTMLFHVHAVGTRKKRMHSSLARIATLQKVRETSRRRRRRIVKVFGRHHGGKVHGNR